MTAPPAPDLDAAYAACARITREQARNFSYGIRLLAPDQRGALCAVYALARRADDIGDDPDATPAAKLTALAGLRGQLDRLAAGAADPADPVLAAVGDVARRYPLPLEAFTELVEGIEMDVRATSYQTFDELVEYCRRVAGTVGRLCLGIFGTASGRRDPRGPALADRLGIALQQTNILRDIREDLLTGRVYLPAEDLDRFGVRLAVQDDGRVGGPPERLAALVQAGAQRAETWYADGLGLLDLLDRRSFACCAAMAGIYHRLNRVIATGPEQVLERRLSLSARQKGAIALRSVTGRRT